MTLKQKIKRTLICSSISLVGIGTISIPTIFNVNYQTNHQKVLEYSNISTVNDVTLNSLISFPQDSTIDTSVNVFLTWCQDWLKPTTSGPNNILQWLQGIGFIIDKTVTRVTLVSEPNVSLNSTNTEINNISLTFKISTNDGKNKIEIINLSNNNFKPIIITPNAINLLKNDFIKTLETIESSKVNTFLNNYGFKLDAGIIDVEYTNQNYNPQKPSDFYDPTTETITIQFLQYSDNKNSIKIYQNVSFSIKNIYFKLPIKDNPAAIIGIFVSLGIVASVIAYITIKIKRYKERKNKEPKIIHGWEITRDIPPKELLNKNQFQTGVDNIISELDNQNISLDKKQINDKHQNDDDFETNNAETNNI